MNIALTCMIPQLVAVFKSFNYIIHINKLLN